METGGFIRPEETLIPVLQKGSYDYLKQHGYEPYYMYRQKNTLGATRNTNQENVAYARLGKECLYNIFMMEELEDIIAYGAAGSSKHMVYAESESGRSDAAGNTGIPLMASANMTYESVEEDEYETARFGRHFPHESIRMERIENVKSVEDYISRIDEMIERKEKIWH